jgi:pimeloyl-ACP methyl ester carboxylesterase
VQRIAAVALLCIGWLAVPSAALPRTSSLHVRGTGGSPSLAIESVFPVAQPRGLIVTTGGWIYCANTRTLAREAGYTLLCGRYAKDGYTWYNLHAKRHLDWGNPVYLAQFAHAIARVHRQVGGPLIFVGVSYSAFGMATLASHHPELRPSMLVVVDSYLDLVARWRHSANDPIGREIERETGPSLAALKARSVDVKGLAKLIRRGTKLSVIWSITNKEKWAFQGATCARDANANTLAKLANVLGRPVSGWVTRGEHGFDLWDNASAILAGHNPGREVRFRPGGAVPANSYCH